MRILYPSEPFSPRKVEEAYAEEWNAMLAAGHSLSLFDLEELQQSGSFRRIDFEPGEKVLYRGWMMNEVDYRRFFHLINKMGGQLQTSVEQYLLCHHLPNWYPFLLDHTPETRFYKETDNIVDDLRKHGWENCFLKDHVKSLSTDCGSMVLDLSTLPLVISKMREYRGEIEGGICARRIEDLDAASERRFFVYEGVVYSDDAAIPQIVMDAASVIKSPFFSVDVANIHDGTPRIIELGDGQVSDRKHWSVETFVSIFNAH